MSYELGLKARSLTDRCRQGKQNIYAGCVAFLRDSAVCTWQSARSSLPCEATPIVDENSYGNISTQLAAPSWMGRARGMVDALRGLELDLARHQDRLARFAADFVRGDSFSNRDHRAASCVDRPHPITPAAPQRLRSPGNYGSPHVRCELHVAVLGGAARLIRSCCRPSGDHSHLRNDLRTLDAAG